MESLQWQDKKASEVIDDEFFWPPVLCLRDVTSMSSATRLVKLLTSLRVQRRQWPAADRCGARDLTTGNCGKWLIRQPLERTQSAATMHRPNGCRPRKSWPGREVA